jgi:mannonate dehydratase
VLARLNLPLISHAGLERAVVGTDTQDYGNPLRLRRALDAGVRVVAAHCASMGQDRDLDRGENGPLTDSFELFARMLGEARYEARLFGDISAMTQLNRAGPALAQVVERSEWHARLLNGSDLLGGLPGVARPAGCGRGAGAEGDPGAQPAAVRFRHQEEPALQRQAPAGERLRDAALF